MKGRRTLLTLIFTLLFTSGVFASTYNITVKGEPLNADIKVINDQTMIGYKDIGEALGIEVNYDKITNTVIFKNTYNTIGDTLILHLDSGLAYADIWGDGDLYFRGRDVVNLDLPPILDEEKVYVPLRFVCETFASPINVDGKSIAIGDIFTSEIPEEEGEESKGGKVLYEKYLFDTDIIKEMLEVAIDYLDDLIYYFDFYLGPEGYEMAMDIMEVYSTVAELDMCTQEGYNVKKAFENYLLSLATQFNDLGDFKIPAMDGRDRARKHYIKMNKEIEIFMDKKASYQIP